MWNSFALVVCFFIASVYGHGYLTIPFSRTRLAYEAGMDTCPECSILEPVTAWPDVAGAPVGKSGPCGFNARSGIDYNKPGSAWGNVIQTFRQGEVIDVQWCVDNNGDHGGMFSYRICQDQALVDKFLDPNYLPTVEEKQAAEDCFQRGILACTDVDGQTCNYNADCQPGQACYRNDWFTCGKYVHELRCKSVDGHTPIVSAEDAQNRFKYPNTYDHQHESITRNVTNPFCNAAGSRQDCGYVGIDETECLSRACCWSPSSDGSPWCFHINDGGEVPGGSCKTYTSYGYTVSSKIRIPYFQSNHTLISFRWSSYQTPQVYLFCSDVAIV